MGAAPGRIESPPSTGPDRRQWMALGMLSVLAVFLYLPTWLSIVGRWKVGGGYPHGWLLAAATIWVLISRGDSFAARNCQPASSAALLTLFAGLAWLASVVIGVQVAEQFFALAVVVSLPLAVFGLRSGFLTAAAIALLGFGLPVWDYLGPTLQRITTEVTGVCLSSSGVPVLIEGNLVTIPAGQFQIVAGCSGLNYFVAAGALSAIFGALWLDLWRHRFLLLAVALSLSIFANWLRVYTVIISGHLTDMQSFLVQVDHYYFGWILFGIGMIPVYLVGERLERREKVASTRNEPPVNSTDSVSLAIPAIAVAIAAAAGPAAWLALSSGGVAANIRPELTPSVSGWKQAPSSDDGDWALDYKGAKQLITSSYQRGAERVDFSVAWYPSQSQGRELVYFENHLADPERWRLTKTQQNANCGVVKCNLQEIVAYDGQRRIVGWWFEVGGRVALTDGRAKLLQLQMLFKGRRDGGVIAVSARCEKDCRKERASVIEFVSALGQPALSDGNQGAN